jgi:hypothetical protein
MHTRTSIHTRARKHTNTLGKNTATTMLSCEIDSFQHNVTNPVKQIQSSFKGVYTFRMNTHNTKTVSIALYMYMCVHFGTCQ